MFLDPFVELEKSEELVQAGGSTQAGKGPRKIIDLAPKQFADGVQQPCNNLDAWQLPLDALFEGLEG